MTTYAIGDVQGCSTQLSQLLDRINFDPTADRLWFVGDLVNRGSNSLKVLRYIKQLGPAAQIVLGNHDLFLLAVAEDIVTLRPKDTIQDVLGAEDRAELMDWLRRHASITRVLTRLRTCTPAGDLSGFSGPPEQAPAGYLPWFRIPNRKNADATVICGHWAALGLHIEPNLLAIDSGCVWGKKLSAVRLEDRKIFQVAGVRRARP